MQLIVLDTKAKTIAIRKNSFITTLYVMALSF